MRETREGKPVAAEKAFNILISDFDSTLSLAFIKDSVTKEYRRNSHPALLCKKWLSDIHNYDALIICTARSITDFYSVTFGRASSLGWGKLGLHDQLDKLTITKALENLNKEHPIRFLGLSSADCFSPQALRLPLAQRFNFGVQRMLEKEKELIEQFKKGPVVEPAIDMDDYVYNNEMDILDDDNKNLMVEQIIAFLAAQPEFAGKTINLVFKDDKRSICENLCRYDPKKLPEFMTLKVILHHGVFQIFEELDFIQGTRKRKSSTAAIAQIANVQLDSKVETETPEFVPKSFDADELIALAQSPSPLPMYAIKP